MSTHFVLLKKILAAEAFDGRLEAFGVGEQVIPGHTTEKWRCLTDGESHLWASIDDNGFLNTITRYGANAPGPILDALCEAFETEAVSE